MSTTATAPDAPLLALEGISKRFVGVKALDRVDLRLRRGEVHALMGQNGAGKSTLIKVMTGVFPADAGRIVLDGRAIAPATPLAAQALGISTVYQEVNLCPNLSVAENIYAGRYPKRLGRIDWARIEREARALLARLDLAIDVTRLLSDFPVAVRQMVAIARALAIESRVLILDEPTSSLDDDEVQRLFEVLRRLRAEGLAILFVTHFIEQVYAVCDRITVLRNGALVGEWTAEVLPPAGLIAAMVGRELAGAPAAERPAPPPAAVPRLAARGLGRKGVLQPTDLQVAAGEVLGLGGLLGSGRTELVRLLFGLDRADAGTLQVDGRPAAIASPADAIRLGFALCPEDRKQEGIVDALSLRENIALALQARMGLRRTLSAARQAALAERYVRELGIRTADLETPIGRLSGGNQQKALLARWLATEPRLLLLDEPTRGIDVAAKQEILDRIAALAREAGLAVVFVSSELEEVARVADRIAVLRDRRKIGELPGGGDAQAVFEMIAAGA